MATEREANGRGGGMTGASESHDEIRAAWLCRVRWAATAGEVTAIIVARAALGIDLPIGPLLALLALAAGSNVALGRRVRRGAPLSARLAGATLVFDTLVLTALLYGSGGRSNPFSTLYVVQIVIAAVMLGSRWAWLLAALSIGCYAVLFALPPSAAEMFWHGHDAWSYQVHLQGMWVALCLAAALVAYFVTRLSTAIERRDTEIAGMRETAARQDRLAALTTLAAGAAHELATPMATIAVTARELECAVGESRNEDAERLREDARLIRSEVERCRRILDGMAPGSGEDTGPVVASLRVDQIASEVMGKADAHRVVVECRTRDAVVQAPPRALASAIGNLVSNALDASPRHEPVTLAFDTNGAFLRVTVIDHGDGMPPSVLPHAGEPFFTTKPPGRGLGLGLFLTRTLAERLGGRLTIESNAHAGTIAVLEIPLAATTAGSADVGT